MRLLVRGSLDRIEIEVHEARGTDRQITLAGVLLRPQEWYVGSLPLAVRRGTATLGVHTDEDVRTTFPRLVDGQMTAKQLLAAAAEFDSDSFGGGMRHSAQAFVQYLTAYIEGTPEQARYTADLRNALAALGAAEEN